MAQAVFGHLDVEFAYDGPFMDGGDEAPDWKEAAGQTFKKNDPVYLNTNGLIALVVAGSNKIDKFLGFAMNDASGVTNTPVSVRVPSDGDRFALNHKPSGGGSQATAQATLGVGPGNFDLDTSNGNVLVWNPTSVDKTKPWGTPQHLWTEADAGFSESPEAVGDLNGHVVIKINRQSLQ